MESVVSLGVGRIRVFIRGVCVCVNIMKGAIEV